MDRLKSGLSNCNYYESRTLCFWTGTLKSWYPCVLDSFNLDLIGNTAHQPLFSFLYSLQARRQARSVRTGRRGTEHCHRHGSGRHGERKDEAGGVHREQWRVVNVKLALHTPVRLHDSATTLVL